MKLLIAVLLFVGVLFRSCGFENSNPPQMFQPQRIYITPERTQLLPPNTGLFEDFDGKFQLNWSVLGLDASHWSLTKFPGTLTITTQSGSFEYAGDNYKNVFLVDFPADQSQDFQLTTCIMNFQPTEIWNQAGLVLWNDKNNYFKFVYEYGEETGHGDGLLFTAGREIRGRPGYAWFMAEQMPQTMWLRIIKRGDLYELYNSTDGKTFNPVRIYRSNSSLTNDNSVPILSIPIKSVGVFTSNYTSASAPQVDASFDFFEFKILPKEK